MEGWKHFGIVIVLLQWTSEAKDYCHNEEFVADCRPQTDITGRQHLILIDQALYGRMAIGPCVKTDFGFVGCYNDVTSYIHSRCSGRSTCNVRVPDPVLDHTKPCNEDLKSYLEANFSCVEISQPQQDGVCKSIIPVNNAPLYFVSLPYNLEGSHSNTGEYDCGLPKKPWVVTAQVGQKLNITLMDFSKASNNNFPLFYRPLSSSSESVKSSAQRQQPHHVKRSSFGHRHIPRRLLAADGSYFQLNKHHRQSHRIQNQDGSRLAPNGLSLPSTLRDLTCDQYAMVEEILGSMLHPSPLKPKVSSSSSFSSASSSSSSSATPSIKHYLCGNGTQPWTRTYVSQTHQVRLTLLLPSIEDHYYVVRIQAVGCPDNLPTPSNSWMRRESETEMVVGCLDDFDHTWTLTCIDHRWEGSAWNCSAVGDKDARRGEMGAFSIGAAVFVVVGVSFFIGLLVLFIGLFYIKRRRALSGGGLQMRDMRPLNSDSYSPTSNLITNNHPSNKPSSNTSTATTTSGKAKTGKNNKEYECVWEIPSGKSLTLLARDTSPNKMSNQYLNENRGSTSTSKLDSFKQKNLIVKTPLKDDLRQKAFFGNSQAGKTGGGGTCSCCCQENFNTDPLFQQGPRRIGPTVTSAGHMTIGHMPRLEDAPDASPQKQPSCLTFPKQSPTSPAALATRQNHLNNNINNLQLAEEASGHVCRHCGHSSDDSTFISESTPSVFVDSTAPAPVLSHRLVTPGSETLARKSFLPLNAAEMFKRSQDSGMPSSLGSIRHHEGHDPVISTRHQQQLSQRHSVPREASNDSNNASTESAETPPVLHPRKRRT